MCRLVLVAVLHDVHHLREKVSCIVLGKVALFLKPSEELTTLTETK